MGTEPAQSDRHAVHADNGCHCDQQNLVPGRIHQQHIRTHCENKRNDESCDGKACGVHACLHRASAGNGRSGIRRQRHRRRDIRHNAVVEDEEMCADHRYTHLDQDRRAGRSHDAVGRRSRQAHAQNDTADHRQQETEEQLVLRDDHDRVDHRTRQARDRQAATDHSGHAAGHRNGNAASAAVLQGFKYMNCPESLVVGPFAGLQRFSVPQIPVNVADDTHNDCRQDGYRRGELHRLGIGADQVDQDRKGQKEIAFLQQFPDPRQLFPAQAFQSQPFRLQVNGQEHAQEIQARGQDRPNDDIGIRHAQIIRHQKCRGAHDRRHDLPARGGRRFHGAGKVLVVSCFLHHRDRDGSGGDRVADRRAGNHAAQCGRYDRDLGRSAGKTAGQGIGHRDEEFGDARFLQEGSEYDKHHDVFRADVDRCGEQAVLVVEQLMHHIGQQFPVLDIEIDRIGQEHTADAEDREADASPAQFKQHQESDDSRDDIDRVVQLGLDPHRHQGRCPHREIEIRGGADNHQHDIIPGNMIDPDMALLRRIRQVSHDHDQPQEGTEPDLFEKIGEKRDIDAIERKHGKDGADDILRNAFPYTRIALPVILPHDRFRIGRGLCSFIHAGGFGCFRDQFLLFHK